MASLQSFNIYAGDTKTLEVALAGITSTVGLDFFWKLARLAGGPPIVSKSTTDGTVTTLSPDTGTFVVHLEEQDTINLFGVFWHEGWTENSDGEKTTATAGYVTITSSMKS